MFSLRYQTWQKLIARKVLCFSHSERTSEHNAVNLHKLTLYNRNLSNCRDMCSKMIRTSQNYTTVENTMLFLSTVLFKCTLTVSTRNSILDPSSFQDESSFEARVSIFDDRESSFEVQVSRHLKNFLRIWNRDFENTI